MPRIAKVFQSGNSQAIRLPKEFRFDVDEVEVSREGDAVILRPRPDAGRPWASLRAALERRSKRGDDLALVDRRRAVKEMFRVFGEQRQLRVCWQLDDNGAPAGELVFAYLLLPLSIEVQ